MAGDGTGLKPGKCAKAAAVEPEWRPARPIVLELSGTSGLARAAARFSRLPGGEGNQNYWRLEAVPAGAGILLAR